MIQGSASSYPLVRRGVWIGVLAIVTVGIIWDAMVRSRHVLEVSASYGVAVDAPAIAPESPTGYALGRRSMVLPAGASDTYHWIMQTQTMIARGDWRIRWVDYDNAPLGREVHWAGPFHWWLAGLAWADHLVSGRPLGISVERATLYSGPMMLGLLLFGLGPFLQRRFSPWAAVLFALGSVAYFPFYVDFEAGYADHHGLANTCCLLTVLFLGVGAFGATGEPARRWFVASAVAGGLGLWISTATQAPVLLGLGLGVLAAGWLTRGASPLPDGLNDPDLWRIWGRVGGGISFAAHLLEYFPNHLGWRLEVNHPLYAVAWIGAGELFRVVAFALRDGVRSLTPRKLVTGAGGAALVALLPVIILFTAAKTFTVADPFVWQVHSMVSEIQPLVRMLAKGWSWTMVALCLPMLLLVPPLWLVLRRSTPSEVKAQMVLALLPALLGWVMGWSQVRWLSLAFALTIPLVAVFFRYLESARGKIRRPAPVWLVAGGLLLLPGAVRAVQVTRGAAEFNEEDIHNLAQRDVAHWLRLRAGDGRVVVVSSPASTTRLIYYGGITGVDTIYWENGAGLKKAAELFATPSVDAAHEIAGRLGLTHIVYFSWTSFEVTLVRLQRGLPPDAPPPEDAFAIRLFGAPVPPPWLRPLPFKLPDHPALQGSMVRIWEITPDQSPAVALAGAANYFLELGLIEEAGRLAPALARFEDDLAANVMLAGIASRQRNPAEFSTSFSRILPRLDRAGSLSLEEHVHLVVVLTVAGRLDLAGEQMRGCMNQADEHNLRQLTTGTLADLLALGDALGVALPTAGLQQLAVSLLPPDKRK